MQMDEKKTFLAPRGRPAAALKHSLPPRVCDLIAQQEAASERLIGWVQLGVVALFAALFLLAPRPNDAPMRMLSEPVPMALAAYAAFTLGRLVLAYRRPLPGSIITLSILVDIVLLLWLIWAFHLQYGQSAAFSLRVPSFIYIFVFIALRVLRFDHRLVLAAGLLAATGWAAFVALVLNQEGASSITRSFVDYMSGKGVLLGAEFDKIFTILLVTGLLALAVYRAREMLITAVKEHEEGVEIRRFLPGGVANAITSSDKMIEAGRAQERLAAILMLDIRGFTQFSRTATPRDVVDMLTSLHARVIPIVEAHGGVVDKFLGDGVMVTFGAVEPSERAAADAMRALQAVLHEAQDWRETLPALAHCEGLALNGSIAAGHVVFATLGNSDRLEYTVIGEAVNLAAKLEKHNKEAGSLAIVAAGTLALARSQGFQMALSTPTGIDLTLNTIENCRVAGLDEPVDIVAVTA